VLKSTIFGNVQWYWHQNTDKDDYQHAVQRFAMRLEARGHDREEIRPLFQEAFKAISQKPDLPTPNEQLYSSDAADPLNTLFNHLEYHP
jgi:hypothetical protein